MGITNVEHLVPAEQWVRCYPRFSVEFTKTPGNASDVINPMWAPAGLILCTKNHTEIIKSQ